MNKLLIFCLGLLGLTFVNCGVNEATIECPPNFTGELLESETKLVGEWIVTGVISDTPVDLTNDEIENPNVNMFDQYSECSRDAIFVFNENRNYLYDVGSKAFGCNKTSTLGTWKLNSNELLLIFSCSVANYTLVFDDINSQFEYSNNIDIQEVNGLVTSAKVTFTVTKV
jgi:hypothetical protein